MLSNERATVIAAAIGGICIFLAAVIGLFTPVISRLSERILSPTETPLPTATWTPSPSPTPLVPPTETPNPSVVFLVYNNFENPQDLYVDGQLEAAVDSGSYATFRTQRGSHLLTSCARGKNPQVNPESCIGRTFVVQEDPFFWEMTGNKIPEGDATLIVRDISSIDVDFFIDDKLTTSVDRGTYIVLKVPVGVRSFQACPRGLNPQANPKNCGLVSRYDLENAIQSWTIHD
jgi:hypothetical protein